MRSPLAVNVDCSRGTIRGRDGFTTMLRVATMGGSGITPSVNGIHAWKGSHGEPYVCSVLFDRANNRNIFIACDLNGAYLDSSMPIDLAKHPVGMEPSKYNFPTFETMGSGVIFTTPKGTILRYDPESDPSKMSVFGPGEPLPLPPDNDTERYFTTLPRASLFHSYAGMMVYAGFDYSLWNSVSSVIPENQSDIPEENIDQNLRNAIRLARHQFIVSLPGEPTNIRGSGIFPLGRGETITGLSSMSGSLLVFTETSVYMAQSNGMTIGQIGPLVRGTGCVGQRTIAQGRGRIAWMGHDGFHMYDGQQVLKISDDLDDMFELSGWRPAPMYGMSSDRGKAFAYPFRIARSALDRAVGIYDEKTQAFWWSVPVCGSSNLSTEFMSRICLLYHPSTQSWSIYAGSATSCFEPTDFAAVFDGTRYRVLFGDPKGGIHFYGEDSSDKNFSSSGSRAGDTRVEVDWFWQSPPLEMDPNATLSVRSLRTKQRATGASRGVNEEAKWSIETERSFDNADGSLTYSGYLQTSPTIAPPQSETPKHLWGEGTWEGGARDFTWHTPATWRSRHSVQGAIVGQAFYVGFSDSSVAVKDAQVEIQSFDLELQPKRDIT